MKHLGDKYLTDDCPDFIRNDPYLRSLRFRLWIANMLLAPFSILIKLIEKIIDYAYQFKKGPRMHFIGYRALGNHFGLYEVYYPGETKEIALENFHKDGGRIDMHGGIWFFGKQ